MSSESTLEEIKIKADTRIHIGGLPFWTKEDTTILGMASSWNLVNRQIHAAKTSPDTP